VIEPTYGEGSFLEAAAEAFPRAHLEGFDINPEHLRLARSRLADAGAQSRAVFHHQDFFAFDWYSYLAQKRGNILLLANLPWVTNSAVAALNGDLAAVAEMRAAFDRRRRVMTSMLNGIDGVTCAEPEGAFYCFPNVTGLLGRPLKGRVSASSAELAGTLLEVIKVAVVPGEAFGAPGFFRLSYALGDDDLVEGLHRLADLVAAG